MKSASKFRLLACHIENTHIVVYLQPNRSEEGESLLQTPESSVTAANNKSYKQLRPTTPGSSQQLPEGVQPSMLKCLAKVFLPSILTCAALKLVHDTCLFVSPIVLRYVSLNQGSIYKFICTIILHSQFKNWCLIIRGADIFLCRLKEGQFSNKTPTRVYFT